MITRSELLNDSEEAMRLILDGRQGTLWTALPAIVTKVDLSAMTLEVQPTIKGVITDDAGGNSYVNLPLLVDVPIVFPSAGGFTITFPIVVNDEVLVIIASRCIDAWWQQGGIQPPMEARMHDLSDGFAIPGPKSQPRKISGISSTSVQIRKDDGTAYLELTPAGGVNIVAPGGVNIVGVLTATEVTAGGIGLSTHKHIGVTTGVGTSGTPVP